MAAPTKVEREKREQLKKLKLFTRDNDIYTSFEFSSLNSPSSQISYMFCAECRHRDIAENGYMGIVNIKDKRVQDFMIHLTKYIPKDKIENFKKLQNLSETNYFRRLYLLYSMELPKINNYGYRVLNLVDTNEISAILGDEKSQKYTYYSEEIPVSVIDEYTLNQEDLLLLKNSNLTFIPLIKRDTIFPELYEHAPKNRVTYVELDFTKPIEELIEFVKTIKKDFDEDPNAIQNLNDLLGNEDKIYKCDIEECDIYKTNNVKPISGRLADVLFIYDCRKAGLNNDYILKEINKYWTETKKLFKDEMQLKTLREYYELAIDYIDNKKYKCYLSGYDIHNKK